MTQSTHRHSLAYLIGLLILITTSALADYAPGELIIKLRRSPERGTLDEIGRTDVRAIDDLVAARSIELKEPLRPFLRRFALADRLVQLTGLTNPDSLKVVIERDPNVEWVSHNYRYRSHGAPQGYIPNDSLFSEQWWLEKISAPLAWEITQGDTDIVIGIIDTGVDYLHSDLVPNLWHNWADADSDGVDDDDNGFIDDVIGWDFVDAPAFPSAGDYLERDNDPADDHGHGTYVAGVASAATDNETCYASVGFNCRLMALRAGNADGLFEDDDIAAAILYGTANGVTVINMSFGDVVASPLLRETIRIAHSEGVVLVSSAGNHSSPVIEYPSGFPEVISVGSSNEVDQKANHSNYGPSVDVLAPGTNILSTMVGDSCGRWSNPFGTSYASPMVAATAGLILSINPSLKPDDILDIVRNSADDVLHPGWDTLSTHGRLNVRRAVEQAAYGSSVVARITAPYNDTGVDDHFAVLAEAWGSAFESYSVSVGLGENPLAWSEVSSGSERHYGDTIAWIEPPSMDTVMNVRLEVAGSGGLYALDHVHLFVQRGAPRIDSLKITRMLDWDSYSDLIQVWANQTVSASMLLTNQSGDSIRDDFGYLGSEHVGLLLRSEYPGDWNLRVRLENLTGLDVISDPFALVIDTPPLTSNEWIAEPTGLMAGEINWVLTDGTIGEFLSDYDCDGQPEMWYIGLSYDGVLDTLKPLEAYGYLFEDTRNRYGLHLPQAYGDADGDGLDEMMARRYKETRIWEQSSECGVPNNVVFESVETWEEFLGGGFVDLDSLDGRGEIIARIGIDSVGSRFAVFSVAPDYTLTLVDTLPNLTEGGNSLGPPDVVVGDLDRDGLVDFLYGDYDGDIVFCEYTGSGIAQRWSERLPINDATSWSAAGDLDGDGEIEFIAGCRSNSQGGTESQRRSLHWEYFIYERTADNEFTRVDSIFILGNEDVRRHPASVTVGNIDDRPEDEIIISAFPDLYIVRFNPVTESYEPCWHRSPAEANAAIVVDLDQNGVNEFLFSDGGRILAAGYSSGAGVRPSPPLHLTGEPTGPTSIHLEWFSVTEADSYRVYQRLDDESFQALLTVNDTSIGLTSVPEDTLFFYAVTAINAGFPEPESVFSTSVSVTANAAPSVNDTAHFVEPHFVRVEFSEPMGPSSLRQGSYRIAEDGRMPAVATDAEGGRVIFLAFDGVFAEGLYTLDLRDLLDAQGSTLPAGESPIVFTVEREQIDAPRIASHRLLGGAATTDVEITFSQTMSESALDAARYRMDYGRVDAPTGIASVTAAAPDRSVVVVHLHASHPVGSLGLPARLLVRGVENEAGVPIDTASGQADLLLGGAATTLDQAFVFPNPYRGIGAGGGAGVNFAGLPSEATIRIFTIQGRVVKEIEYEGESGAVSWDLRNEEGDEVAAGVYLFVIESGGDEKRGKLAVMR